MRKWHVLKIGAGELKGLHIAVACFLNNGDRLPESLKGGNFSHSPTNVDGKWVYLVGDGKRNGELTFPIPAGLPGDIRMGLSLRIGPGAKFKLERVSEKRPFEVRIASDGRGYVNNLRLFPDQEFPDNRFEPIVVSFERSLMFYNLWVYREVNRVDIELL